MTPSQREAWELYQQLGSYNAVAKALGRHRKTVTEAIKKADKYMNADQGIKDAMVGTKLSDIGNVHSGWLKTDEASIYFRLPQEGTEETSLEHIKEFFEGIPPCPTLPMAEESQSDTLTVYPISDAHIGMRSSKSETGDDYDNDIAVNRIKDGIQRCVASSPPSARAIILDVGDLTHADNNDAQTPRSKHPLDVSSNFFDALEAAIHALSFCIETAAQKHDEVLVRILRGNHNETSYLAVMFALAERYRNEPRVTIETSASDFFIHEFGINMICAHHGDRAKADRFALFAADHWPDIWGRTRNRIAFVGHLHHAKVMDVGGIQIEQLRAVTPKDAYATSHGYSARSQMQSITYHRDEGEIGRVTVVPSFRA